VTALNIAGTAILISPTIFPASHYNTMYLPKILERIEKTAPPGADLKSWRY
jgi:hypothetical protein